jgi:hypothetical protein
MSKFKSHPINLISYYRVDIHQWIENNQILNGNIRLLENPIISRLFNQIELSK